VTYDVSSQGDLELLGGELVGLTKVLEIDVRGVSGNVLRLNVTYTLQNGTKLKYVPPQLGEASFDFWIIPANLSRGDKALQDTWVNETRNEVWLGFKRGVCYAARLMRLGELTFNWTGHYDRRTGVAFSYFYGVFNGSALQASCTFTIRSASMISEDAPLPPALGIPTELILLGIAISVAAIMILRSRRAKPRTTVLDNKQTQITKTLIPRKSFKERMPRKASGIL